MEMSVYLPLVWLRAKALARCRPDSIDLPRSSTTAMVAPRTTKVTPEPLGDAIDGSSMPPTKGVILTALLGSSRLRRPARRHRCPTG